MKECNFPLVCGIGQGVCCKYCKKECKYKCELSLKECGLSEDVKE